MLDTIIAITSIAFVVGMTSIATSSINDSGVDSETTYEVRYIDETGDEGITRITMNDVELNQIDEFTKDNYICDKAYTKHMGCLEVEEINN